MVRLVPYDAVKDDVEAVYRSTAAFAPLSVLAACNHFIFPDLYEHMSGRKSGISAAADMKGSTSLNYILYVFSMIGVDFDVRYNDCEPDVDMFKLGFRALS
jgi:hypothetical protein